MTPKSPVDVFFSPKEPVCVYRSPIWNRGLARTDALMIFCGNKSHSEFGAFRLSCLIAVLISAASVLVAAPTRAQDDPGAFTIPIDPLIEVDLLLIIATDVSGSVSHNEAFLQRKGVADAFRHRDVITAIESGSLGRIAVAYIDWSSRYYNQVLVNWTMIDGEATALEYANVLMRIPRTRGQGTSISDVLEFSMNVFEISPYYSNKRVIDISGDGPNRSGTPLLEAREEVISNGVVINGLPVVDPYGWDEFSNLAEYFRGCVIGGPGAFVQAAEGFADFSRAIRRKLVLELSSVTPEDIEPELVPRDRPRLIPTQSVPLPQNPNLQPYKEEYRGACDTWDFYR